MIQFEIFGNSKQTKFKDFSSDFDLLFCKHFRQQNITDYTFEMSNLIWNRKKLT